MSWEVPIGMFSAVSGAGLGYLAYRRSTKVDAVSAQSGIASDTRAGTAQIIEALNSMIDTLQEDNATFRADFKYLTARLDVVIGERDELKREVTRLRRLAGENGPPIPSS
jgi:hypothetical protein